MEYTPADHQTYIFVPNLNNFIRIDSGIGITSANSMNIFLDIHYQTAFQKSCASLYP